MRPVLKSLLFAGMCVCSLLFAARGADAQGAKTAAAAPLPTGKAAADEFTALMAQRQQLEEKIRQLEKDFEAADQAGKNKIQEEFKTLIVQFNDTSFKRLVALAPIVYKENPKAVEAGEIVMEMSYHENQYVTATRIAEQLWKDGDQSAEVLNVGGAANFALHNFKQAQQLFDEAKKRNSLDPNIGGTFSDAAVKYVGYWAEEQQIRAREAQLQGDQALPQVELVTDRGKVVLELFENEAPNTVANFISLVERKGYDGTRFHRVIPNFMVQGGDPNSRDDDPKDDGQGGPGYNIPCECYRKDARRHFRGSLSMAHGGKDTGGSQFFVTHIPTHWLNAETAPAGHTVFGRVVSGMEVIDATRPGEKLVSARVLRKRNHAYQPKTLAAKPPAGRSKTAGKTAEPRN